MNNERKSNSGLRITIWPAVLVAFLLVVGALSPIVASADQVASSNSGTLDGSIQSGDNPADCTTVVYNGSYTPAPTGGCTLTIGYWKNHWPYTSTQNDPLLTIYQVGTLSPTSFSIYASQAYDYLSSSVQGNALYILMKQLIAATLNQWYGAGSSTDMQSYYNQAVQCAADAINDGTLCPNATTLAGYLDTYNNGNATGNPNHCPNAPQWTQYCATGTPPSSANLSCGDGLYGVYYTYQNGQFLVDYTDYNNPYFCMTKSQCPADSGLQTCDNTLPCKPVITVNGVVLECPNSGDTGIDTSNLNASTLSSCPINEVLRSPYPRTMVNVPTQFFLQPALYDDINGYSTAPQSPKNLSNYVDSYGNPTEEGYNLGIWQNLVLTVRSHRFSGGETWLGQTVPQPNFVFSDRAWNNPPYPSEQNGPQATYVYRTSSYGINNKHGREFDMVNKLVTDIYDLPSYSVQTNTYCGHDWKASVQLSTRNWHQDGSCYQTILYPDGSTYTPPGTSPDGCNPGWVAPGHWIYSWKSFVTDWNGVNMTQAGLSTTYDVQPNSVSGGIYDNVTYWDAPNGIWVPVLEVQSVLRGKCVAEGTCAPPAAEPNSIAH